MRPQVGRNRILDVSSPCDFHNTPTWSLPNNLDLSCLAPPEAVMFPRFWLPIVGCPTEYEWDKFNKLEYFKIIFSYAHFFLSRPAATTSKMPHQKTSIRRITAPLASRHPRVQETVFHVALNVRKRHVHTICSVRPVSANPATGSAEGVGPLGHVGFDSNTPGMEKGKILIMFLSM
jgi:hypothetical protein